MPIGWIYETCSVPSSPPDQRLTHGPGKRKRPKRKRR